MDERTDGLDASASPESEAQRLEAQVEATREHLDALVGEIDRRRHRAAFPALLAGSIGAFAVGIALWTRHRHRRRTRFDRVRRALSRAWDHPEGVAKTKPRSVRTTLIATTTATALSIGVQQLISHLHLARPKPDSGRAPTT